MSDHPASSIFGKTEKLIPGKTIMVFASKAVHAELDHTMRCYKVLTKDVSGLWMYWFNGFHGPDGMVFVGDQHDFSKTRRQIESTEEFLGYAKKPAALSPRKLSPWEWPPQVARSKS